VELCDPASGPTSIGGPFLESCDFSAKINVELALLDRRQPLANVVRGLGLKDNHSQSIAVAIPNFQRIRAVR
jgi:hypothetical protein